MIREVIEGRITWFADLTRGDLPQRLPPDITLHIRDFELGIEVQDLVGALPLSNGDTLHIIPKIGTVNFLRLLFRAEGAQEELDREYDAFVSYGIEDEQNVGSIVARQLLLTADEIMRRSPLFGRVRRIQRGVFAAGRLRAIPTVLATAQRKREPATYDVWERTLDIAENRVITEALMRGWLLMSPEDRSVLRPVYERWIARFPRCRIASSDLREIKRNFASRRYGGSRDYYRKALMLTQVVLGSEGLGFGDAAALEGDAVLLRTSDVFESYLRKSISEAHAGSRYVVTKGGVHTASLYIDGSFELEPDVVIEKDGAIVLVADAKYKQPSASDHYQMSAYLWAHGCDRGLLLTPHFDESDEVRVRDFRTVNGKIVRETYLPLKNLDVTEAFLAEVTRLP